MSVDHKDRSQKLQYYPVSLLLMIIPQVSSIVADKRKIVCDYKGVCVGNRAGNVNVEQRSHGQVQGK